MPARFRDSPLGQVLRPAFEACYSLVTRRSGVQRSLDGETFRIDSRVRYLVDPRREPQLRAFLRDRVGPREVVLDVGSHAGLYVLLFCRWSPGAIVHAFEPTPGTRRMLERNVAVNGFSPRVCIQPAAVSGSTGTADFFAAAGQGMSRLGSANPALGGKAKRIQVPTTSLDDHCRRHSLLPTWLRMDIEGFEIPALRGAAEVIRQRRGALQLVVEMHPGAWADSGESPESARALLDELGLDAVPLTGQRDALREYGIVHLVYR